MLVSGRDGVPAAAVAFVGDARVDQADTGQVYTAPGQAAGPFVPAAELLPAAGLALLPLPVTAPRTLRSADRDGFTPVGTVLVDVATQSQLPELPNGCEVSSLSMLLSSAGVRMNRIRLAAAQATDRTPPVFDGRTRDFYRITRWGDPNAALVGNVRGYGYGIYHAPLARLLERIAPGRANDLSGSGFGAGLHQLRLGRPVLVWVTTTMRPATRWVTRPTPHGRFTATKQEHALLVVGYTRHALIINNPLSGRRESVSPEPFIEAWKQLGRQALAMAPLSRAADSRPLNPFVHP